MISFEEFSKMELKVGTVLEAEEVEESEKLIKLMVDLGEDPSASSGREIRQVLAGVKQWYKPEEFVGKQVVIVANLEPRMMMGLESEGMMLAASPERSRGAADSKEGPIFLTTPKPVPPGTKIR